MFKLRSRLLISTAIAFAAVGSVHAQQPGSGAQGPTPNLPLPTWGISVVNVINPGAAVVPGDVLTFTIPGAVPVPIPGGTGPIGTMASVAPIRVAATGVSNATVANGGSGCVGPVATVTGTTGTGTSFFTATSPVNGGRFSGPVTVTSAGQYLTNPTNLANEPVTGSSCVGVQLALTMGAAFLQPQTAGNYNIRATDLIGAQSGTTGNGNGVTAEILFAPNAAQMMPVSQASGSSTAGAIWDTKQGFNALVNETTGNENTAFGYNACGGVTTGNQNTCFGVSAGWGNRALTQMTGITAIGTDSFRNISGTAQRSVGVGGQTLENATNSSANTAVGFGAGAAVTTGNSNTLLGNVAGGTITTGGNNTCIGSKTCNTVLTTGSSNIVLGDGNNAACDVSAAGATLEFDVCADSGTTPVIRGSLSATAQYMKIAVTTVANLAACNAGLVGGRAFVTDLNVAIAYGGTVTGGGATASPVWCNGTAWVQG